ncbi:endonuclease/exonuclease/phosphatase family protein [Alloiococcus sp. CFN-8]|uniref:endonuclease/exonuclease/phosphatase family protein n=1 Tax=Alloiococcus sp. CFN-8 TaxID=3416081 RepID=UPI003CEA746A
MLKKFLKTLGVFLLIALIFIISLLAFLTIREYSPEPQEALEVTGTPSKTLTEGDSLTLLTYNIGYGGLDKNHDFFMDGGETVNVENKEIILNNMEGVKSLLLEENTDVIFIQEVDIDAKRSFGINQVQYINDLFTDDTESFATNFLCDYIPYPLPETIGKVHSGILTLSKFQSSNATRIALPTSFTWPTRVAQLKRCLLVERVPIEGSDKELVLVNLHLEAYDDGSGKAAQSKILMDLLLQEYNKGNYVIAGGDFNQSFPQVDLSAYPLINDEFFKAGILDTSLLNTSWTLAADNSLPTARLLNQIYDEASDDNQYYVIDGFILSPNLILEEIKTLDQGFEYSDHNPVRLKVTLGE